MKKIALLCAFILSFNIETPFAKCDEAANVTLESKLKNTPEACTGIVQFERDTRLPLVYLNIVFQVGTANDPEDQSGILRFLAEMLLRGTKEHTKCEFDLLLDQMGAQLEVEPRAENLILRGAVLSTEISPFLKLLQEILTKPLFPEKEIQKLKSETLSMLQEELGHDTGLAYKKFTKFLFQQHPYSKPTLGSSKTIKNLTRQQIMEHYNRVIRKEFLMVLGTGDAELEKISNWSLQLSQNLPSTILTGLDKKILSKPYKPEIPPGRRLMIIDKPDRTQTQIYGGQIGITMKNSDFFPLYLGNYAFGGSSFLSKLMTEIRIKRGWSYGANSAFKHASQPRSWSFHLFPASKDTANALQKTVELVEELQQNGITQEEFSSTKRSLINQSRFLYNTPSKRIENSITEKTLDLPEGFIRSFDKNLEKVTLDEVNSALKRFIQPNQLTITVLGTAKELLPGLAQATKIEEKNIQVKSYLED